MTDDWQPIETAKEDGKPKLGFNGKNKRNPSGMDRRFFVFDNRKNWPGWYTVPSDYPCYPTHWKPLEPPQ